MKLKYVVVVTATTQIELIDFGKFWITKPRHSSTLITVTLPNKQTYRLLPLQQPLVVANYKLPHVCAETA